MINIDQIFLNAIIGVISGILASYIFLIGYLKYKRPKIKISKHISRQQWSGNKNFFFKFINNTNTDIFDVSIELVLYKPTGAVNGTNLVGKQIDLIDDFKAYIPAKSKQDQHNLHAIRARTIIDLDKEWKDPSSFLQLTIIAKHSLSGLNKVFHQTYMSKECISNSKYKSGDDLSL